MVIPDNDYDAILSIIESGLHVVAHEGQCYKILMEGKYLALHGASVNECIAWGSGRVDQYYSSYQQLVRPVLVNLQTVNGMSLDDWAKWIKMNEHNFDVIASFGATIAIYAGYKWSWARTLAARTVTNGAAYYALTTAGNMARRQIIG
jgi:hypothetical protein